MQDNSIVLVRRLINVCYALIQHLFQLLFIYTFILYCFIYYLTVLVIIGIVLIHLLLIFPSQYI